MNHKALRVDRIDFEYARAVGRSSRRCADVRLIKIAQSQIMVVRSNFISRQMTVQHLISTYC